MTALVRPTTVEMARGHDRKTLLIDLRSDGIGHLADRNGGDRRRGGSVAVAGADHLARRVVVIRQHSAALAYDDISVDPLRWLFGVGSTTAYNAVTLQDILGFDFFYTTGIGWLGVVLTYGLVGAALIAGCGRWATMRSIH